MSCGSAQEPLGLSSAWLSPFRGRSGLLGFIFKAALALKCCAQHSSPSPARGPFSLPVLPACLCRGARHSSAAVSVCQEPKGLRVPLLPSPVGTLVVPDAGWQPWVVPGDTRALLEVHVVSRTLSPAMSLGAGQSRVRGPRPWPPTHLPPSCSVQAQLWGALSAVLPDLLGQSLGFFSLKEEVVSNHPCHSQRAQPPSSQDLRFPGASHCKSCCKFLTPGLGSGDFRGDFHPFSKQLPSLGSCSMISLGAAGGEGGFWPVVPLLWGMETFQPCPRNPLVFPQH